MELITCPSAERFKGPATGKALLIKVKKRPDNHLNVTKKKKKNCLLVINNDAWISCIKYKKDLHLFKLLKNRLLTISAVCN